MSDSDKHERACLALNQINIILDLGIVLMKISDILTESQQTNEAPVGMLKRAGLGIASKLGSTKASGALDTAKTANGLKKAYDRYLGQTGQKPSSETIIAFLQRNNLPTSAAEKALQQAGAAAGVKIEPAKDMKSTLGIGKNAGQPMAVPNKQEPTGDVDTSGDTDYDVPTYQRKGVPEPELKTMTAADELKMRLKAGKGLGKSTGGGFSAAAKAMRSQGLNMSLDNLNDPVMEVDLKSSTVDKIILAAVQDSIKQGMGQQLAAVTSGGAAASSGARNSSDSGLVGAAKQAWDKYSDKPFKSGTRYDADPSGGAEKSGTLNMNQLSSMLPNVDKQALLAAINKTLKGDQLTQQHLSVLGVAFTDVIKANAQDTVKIMNTLKRVSVQ